MTGDFSALRQTAAVADALARALTPPGADLVTTTAETARAAFGAAACSIALLTHDGSELVFTTAVGGSRDITGLRLPASEGIAGWVASTGQPIAVSDLQSDSRFAADVASHVGYVPDAILAAPIEVGDRLLGVIEVLDRDTGRAGSDDDLGLLILFGHQAAVALEAQERSRRIGALLVDVAVGTEATADLPAVQASYVESAATLRELADAFAELAAAGTDGARLATTVLAAVSEFVRQRG